MSNTITIKSIGQTGLFSDNTDTGNNQKTTYSLTYTLTPNGGSPSNPITIQAVNIGNNTRKDQLGLSTTITNAGTGYSTGTGVSTSGGSGTGLTVNITAVNAGGITAINVADPGYDNYASGETLTIQQAGSDNNATFTISIQEDFVFSGDTDAIISKVSNSSISTLDFDDASGTSVTIDSDLGTGNTVTDGTGGTTSTYNALSNGTIATFIPAGTASGVSTDTSANGFSIFPQTATSISNVGWYIGWDNPGTDADYTFFFKIGSLCFPGFTKILLADGTQTEIKDLKRLDLIQTSTGPKPLAHLHYTQCPFGKNYVHIPSNYFGKNLPSEDLYVTQAHPLSLGVINQETKAENPETEYLHLVSKELLALDGINIVHLEEDYYNIVFDTQEEINVQNVKYLSHHPNHKPQKTYRLPDNLVVNKRAETEYKPTFTTLSKFLEQCPEDVAPKDFLAQTIRF